MALDKAEEVLLIGQWSVRKFKLPDQGLIYVDTTTGQTTCTPPREVLYALDIDPEEQGADENPGAAAEAAGEEVSAPAAASSQAPASPRFRRIVLGSKHDVPLKMARDLLEAVREDASIFAKLQQRYSEYPSEPVLPLASCPDALEAAASQLQPGETSDVIGTDDGMQILMRVS